MVTSGTRIVRLSAVVPTTATAGACYPCRVTAVAVRRGALLVTTLHYDHPDREAAAAALASGDPLGWWAAPAPPPHVATRRYPDPLAVVPALQRAGFRAAITGDWLLLAPAPVGAWVRVNLEAARPLGRATFAAALTQVGALLLAAAEAATAPGDGEAALDITTALPAAGAILPPGGA